jgi:serine/threonine protein kinase
MYSAEFDFFTKYQKVKIIGRSTIDQELIWLCNSLSTNEKVITKSKAHIEDDVLETLKRNSIQGVPEIVDSRLIGTDLYGIHYVVLKYIEGQELFEVIKTQNTGQIPVIPYERIKDYLKQLVGIMYEVYTKCNIIHKDIKPDNIIVGGDGKLHIIDWGLACYDDPDKNDVYGGSLEYMSPEFIGDKYIGIENDVWAIGIVTYLMISAAYPWDDADPYNIMLNIRDYDYVLKFPDDMDPELRDILISIIKPKNERATIEELHLRLK